MKPFGKEENTQTGCYYLRRDQKRKEEEIVLNSQGNKNAAVSRDHGSSQKKERRMEESVGRFSVPGLKMKCIIFTCISLVRTQP